MGPLHLLVETVVLSWVLEILWWMVEAAVRGTLES